MAHRYAIATVMVSQEPDATYALVDDPQHVVFLQQECRIYGSLEGSIATTITAPGRLRLVLEEMAVGITNGFLRLQAPAHDAGTAAEYANEGQTLVEEIALELSGDNKHRDVKWRLSPRRQDRLRVFQDLWGRGYVVTFGSKFGADFLIYKDNPERAHAEALVVVKDYEEEFARVDIVSFCRVAKMVKKQFLLASVRAKEEDASDDEKKGNKQTDGAIGNSVVYISLAHALLVSRQQES